MRHRLTLLIPMFTALAVLGACATPQSQSTLSAADQNFLENAAQGSYAEVQGSEMALEKSNSAEVKEFARRMIEDHQAANRQISLLADQKNYVPPTEPSVAQKTELGALNLLSGTAFDKTYIDRLGIASHEATIEQFQIAVEEADDPDVRAFAQKTLPTLRHHLQMAQALNEQQKAE